MDIKTTKTALWINFDGYSVSIWDDGEIAVDRPKKRSRSSSKNMGQEALSHLSSLLAKARGVVR